MPSTTKTFASVCMLLVGVTFSGCNSINSDRAKAYNNFLTQSVNTVVVKMLETEDRFRSGNYDESVKGYKELLTAIDQEIEKVKDRDAFDNNDSLKQSAIALHDYYEQVIRNIYPQIIEILKAANDKKVDIEKIKKIISDSYEEENKLKVAYQTQQETFAKKYHFDLAEQEFFIQ